MYVCVFVCNSVLEYLSRVEKAMDSTHSTRQKERDEERKGENICVSSLSGFYLRFQEVTKALY